MMPFNYHHLYYFYVIATEGSISRATRRLLLAQPTLSTQLKQFETYLGVQLFTRQHRRLELTREGQIVLSYARKIFDLGNELKNSLSNQAPLGQSRLHIGVSNYIPKTIIEYLLRFLLENEPEIFISVAQDHLNVMLKNLNNHMLDFILTDSPFEHQLPGDIALHFIGKIPIVFCAHPHLAETIKLCPQDLHHAPMILPAAPRQIYSSVREYFTRHGIEPRIIGEIDDIEIVRRLVLRGYGIAPLNLLTVKEAPAPRKLVVLKNGCEDNLYENLYLISKKRYISHPLFESLMKRFRIDDYITMP